MNEHASKIFKLLRPDGHLLLSKRRSIKTTLKNYPLRSMGKMKQKMKRILYILALALSILACTDEIDKSNRFTFTGETVADYLMNRSDRYSHMITLFERAGLFSLLNTYGRFTLFLPDNTAVEKYLAEQDSIYWETKDTPNFINTGISSPLVE